MRQYVLLKKKAKRSIKLCTKSIVYIIINYHTRSVTLRNRDVSSDAFYQIPFCVDANDIFEDHCESGSRRR